MVSNWYETNCCLYLYIHQLHIYTALHDKIVDNTILLCIFVRYIIHVDKLQFQRQCVSGKTPVVYKLLSILYNILTYDITVTYLLTDLARSLSLIGRRVYGWSSNFVWLKQLVYIVLIIILYNILTYDITHYLLLTPLLNSMHV